MSGSVFNGIMVLWRLSTLGEACLCQKQYSVMDWGFLSTLHETLQKPYFAVMSNYPQINKTLCQTLPLFLCLCNFIFSPFRNINRWVSKAILKIKTGPWAHLSEGDYLSSDGLFRIPLLARKWVSVLRRHRPIQPCVLYPRIIMFFRGNARVQPQVQEV